MRTRRHFIAASAGLTAAAATPTSWATTASAPWPNRPLRIIVPFAPGGTSDVIARLLSKPLSDALGVAVMVENRTGANGNIGAAAVAQSTDQHSIFLSDLGSLAISPLVSKDLTYKPEDLKGITLLAYSAHLLVVHPSVAANTLGELVTLSKQTRLNVASAGSGSPNHLAVVELAQATGLQWQHVPYKGGAQALSDTAAGNTHMVLNGMLATLPLVQGGKLKVIAVTKRSRVALLPQVPTVDEQGVKNFESGTYQGVMVPASWPAAAVERLNKELIAIIRSPALRVRLVEAGAEVMTATPAETNTFITKERQRWAGVIQRAGSQLEGTT